MRPNIRSTALTATIGSTTSEEKKEESNTATTDAQSKTNKEKNKDYSYWRVFTTIQKLKTNGIRRSSSSSSPQNDETTNQMTNQVIAILQHLATNYAGKQEWVGILNKSTLLDEVEESIVMLSLLINYLEERKKDEEEEEPLTIVDVCCGKGIFSLLASYILLPLEYNVQSIILLDKADICWDHIHAANQENSAIALKKRPTMKIWDNCNLHETDVLQQKIQDEVDGKCILVGIHLCKTLSPSCISLANTLGPDVCVGLLLMPCCLPRAVFRSEDRIQKNNGSFIQVRQYETNSQKREREEAKQHRINAKQRIPTNCYLCNSPNHRIHQCNLLPPDEYEQMDIFAKAAATQPCWKCGKVGNFKSDCPSSQSTDKPSLIRPPVMDVDVSNVMKAEEPFATYVELLGGSIQFDSVRLVDTGLYNDSANHLQITWNSSRKSLCLVGGNKK